MAKAFTLPVLLLSFALAVGLLSCTDTPTAPPPPPPVIGKIQLFVVDSGYTEISLRLVAPEGFEGMAYRLERDEALASEGKFYGSDTVITDRGIESSKTYRYRLFRVDSTGVKDTAEVYASTKFHYQQDTTSHDVTWEIFRFGQGGIDASYFRDVFIIDENDIWAVGRILPDNYGQNDEFGRRIQPFNAVHWDGQEWTLRRFHADTVNGRAEYNELYAVWGFGHTHVVASTGGTLHWWNENRQHWTGRKTWKESAPKQPDSEYTRKIWGNSPDNFYLAGTDGYLMHFLNGKFQQIETNTDKDFYDIHGDDNGNVWVAGFDMFTGKAGIFLGVKDGRVSDLSKNSLYAGAFGVYATDDSVYAAVPNGLQIMSIRDTSHWRVVGNDSTVKHGAQQAMKGSADNNIFSVGYFSNINHYNGISWKMLNTQNLNYATWLVSVAVKNHLVVAVGWDQEKGQAIIYKGTLR